ncbi:hypothetical protein HOP51_06160 [Halomonas sp. MCCC 1A11036]|uniref:Uncharacterized protein n=1 Tax=Billgrantia zhangzhouensis TaxID=2733481 RepID=A0ABS9ACQ2_9GAMM|nr:hypothetical protein [Halomonas zhangzhouensis]MCE8019702.1 hypothetical protein [Halomonas zhangzhouensis]
MQLTLAILLLWQRQGRLGRLVGAAFLATYAAYLAWLGLSGDATLE